MAVDFLRTLGVGIPGYERSELTSCDLGHVDPVERRSDVAIMLRGTVGDDPFGTLMGIVVEVQRDEKKRERFTCPEYVAALRSKHECPVALLVIRPRQEVAEWYSEPIVLGHPRFVLHPIVLGPQGIPVVTDPEEVGHCPTLGALSAAVHGPGDQDVLNALHTGLDLIDEERATKYIGYALHLLSDTEGQKGLEELLMTETYEYTSAWTESLKAEGRTEAILRILDKQGVPTDENAP